VRLRQLPITAQQFATRYGIRFAEAGPALQAWPQIDDIPLYLQAPAADQPLDLYLRGEEPDPQTALLRVLHRLAIERETLPWQHPQLGPARWVLYRVDSNGNEAEMQRFLERTAAEALADHYQRKGHKQCYLIRAAD